MALRLHSAHLLVMFTACVSVGGCGLETDIPPSRWQSGGQTSSVIAIASAATHSCALNAAGAVTCWGAGTSGQLGDTETTSAARPLRLPGAAVDIAISDDTSCIVRSSGELRCWGAQADAIPSVAVAITDAAVFQGAICVTADGVYCGGADPAVARFAPGADLAGTSAVALEAAGERVCLLTAAGEIACWGSDWVVPGRRTDAPETVPTTSPARQLSMSDEHACALFEDGSVSCWGDNKFGQLGQPTSAPSPRPLRVPLAGVAERVFVGPRRSCAGTTDGMFCWGDNSDGLLGDGTTNTPTTPVRMSIGGAISSVSLGETHSCVVLASGQVVCWGSDAFGQLGRGSDVWSSTPVEMQDFVDADDVGVGQAHACIASSAGDVWCVGRNDSGQLGDATLTAASTPIRADAPGIAENVSAERNQTCAGDGPSTECWGILNGPTSPPPPPPVDDIVQQDSEDNFACGRRQNGEVFCWGEQRFGRTGDQRGGATRISLPGPARDVDVGGDTACAALTDGTLYCWGRWAQFAGGARRAAGAVIGLP